MIRSQQGRDAIALFLFVLLVRGALCVFPPPAGLLNVDELEATLNGVDRWLGVPSSALAWPAGVTQLLVQPYVLLSFLFHSGRGHEAALAAFAHHIAGLYVEPAGLITAVRLMGVGFSAAGIACLYLTGRAMNLGRMASLCPTVFWLFSPVTFEYSVMATGDGIAWALALVSVFVLVKWPRHVAVAGAALGCAAASKITVSSLVILHLGLIALRPHEQGRHKLLDIVAFVGAAALGFALLCPQIWIDPVRFGKAVVGNLLFANVDADGPLPLFNRVIPPVLAGIAVLLGLVTIVLAPARWRVTVPLIVASGLMILPLIAGSLRYVRYAVPVMIPLTILTGIAYEELFTRRDRNVRTIGAAAVVVLCAGLSWLTIGDQRELRTIVPMRPLLAELERCRSNHRTILLPVGFYPSRFWRLPANRETWESALPRAAKDVVGSASATAFLERRGLPAAVMQVFWSSFTEREQANFARLRALASVDNPGGCSLKFYLRRQDTFSQRSPLYEMEEDEAVKQFASDGGRYILVTDTVPDGLRGAPHKFGEWYVLGSQ
jgi:hypothetical protein